MCTLELQQLRKGFGAVEIIKGIDLKIDDPEVVVFVGPSGSGKSTLLRMIAGLEDITGGELRINGQLVNNVPPDPPVPPGFDCQADQCGHQLPGCSAGGERQSSASSVSSSLVQQFRRC